MGQLSEQIKRYLENRTEAQANEDENLLMIYDGKISPQLKEFLWNEWKYNNLLKYYYLFDEWIENLTGMQIYYYEHLWLRKCC